MTTDDMSKTNLLSNTSVVNSNPPDSQLLNPWGVANAPNSPLWVSDNNAGVSTLYDGNGVKQGLVVTIPVPSGTNPPAAPTGLVWNPNSATQFLIPGHMFGAVFIWATENGTIAGWNPMLVPSNVAVIIVDNSNGGSNGAVYKGLAFGTNKHGNFLFATNFAAGAVEVFDQSFKLVALDGNFSDPEIPAGFAPFGIANIDNNLYVTYAQQNAQKNDVVAGPGLGFVDVFTTDGILIKRFASRGTLNAPWGLARATQNFGSFSGSILVGNFGAQGNFAGWINAFSAGNDNDFLGPLKGANRQPVAIDGLWSIVFGTFLNSDADTLYFTAGPDQQRDGLFGKILARPRTDDDSAMR